MNEEYQSPRLRDYSAPRLVRYGALRDVTGAISMSGNADGGSGNDKTGAKFFEFDDPALEGPPPPSG